MNNKVNLKVTLENIETSLNNDFQEIICIIYSKTNVHYKMCKGTNENETNKMTTIQKLNPTSLT